MMEAVRTYETSVENYFTRQCIPEDNSEHKFLPALLLAASAGICQRAVVDESERFRSQMGMHSRSENGHSAWNTL
jgi:hypothetical protein